MRLGFDLGSRIRTLAFLPPVYAVAAGETLVALRSPRVSCESIVITLYYSRAHLYSPPLASQTSIAAFGMRPLSPFPIVVAGGPDDGLISIEEEEEVGKLREVTGPHLLMQFRSRGDRKTKCRGVPV